MITASRPAMPMCAYDDELVLVTVPAPDTHPTNKKRKGKITLDPSPLPHRQPPPAPTYKNIIHIYINLGAKKSNICTRI